MSLGKVNVELESIASASVQNEFLDEMTNQFTHISRLSSEQIFPECQPCDGVHVHLQFMH